MARYFQMFIDSMPRGFKRFKILSAIVVREGGFEVLFVFLGRSRGGSGGTRSGREAERPVDSEAGGHDDKQHVCLKLWFILIVSTFYGRRIVAWSRIRILRVLSRGISMLVFGFVIQGLE